MNTTHAVTASGAAVHPAGSPPRPPERAARLHHARTAALTALGWLAALVGLFACYLRVSRTTGVNSDGAANALQAWDMLHGNLLLHGWWLSDVSFYTTELPEYMAVEAARGLNTGVVHVAAALTYTAVVALTALLAKGRARGWAGMIRALIAAGVMLSPQVGDATYTLLLSPDHVGSVVPALLVLLLLDRLRPRWYLCAAAGMVLAWGLVADKILLVTTVVPLCVVAAARAVAVLARGPGRQDADGREPAVGPGAAAEPGAAVGPAPTVGPAPSAGSGPAVGRGRAAGRELAVAGTALVAVGLATGAGAWLTASGGFVLFGVSTGRVPWPDVARHLALMARGLPLLFGAQPHGLGYGAVLPLIHLAGLVLAGRALAAVLRHPARAGLVNQVLMVAVIVNLAGYLFFTRASDSHSVREFAAVLPFGAALAGRVLGPRLALRRWARPVLAAALTCGLLSLGQAMAAPVPGPAGAALVPWLNAHQLRYGLGGYWNANVVTLASGGRIQIAPVRVTAGHLVRYAWESKASWYDPRQHDARFLILSPAPPGGRPFPWPDTVRRAFGAPSRVYQVGAYQVLVWRANLLTRLPALPPPSPPHAPARIVLSAALAGGGAAPARRRGTAGPGRSSWRLGSPTRNGVS